MDSLGSDSFDQEHTVASTVSIILEAQPSCLEFSTNSDLLVIGTYALDPGEINEAQAVDDESNVESSSPAQKRTGSLIVFRIGKQEAILLQTEVVQYAVLDLHFLPSNSSMFAIATSVGLVCFFSIDLDSNGSLTLIKSLEVCDPSILVLSLAFQDPCSGDSTPPMAVSLSDGRVAVLRKEQTPITTPIHSEEAWTVAWSKSFDISNATEGLLYSGGDDSALCTLDTTEFYPHTIEEATTNRHKLLSRDIKTHGAGVTAIVVLPVFEEDRRILVTGSYDEHIRVLLPSTAGLTKAKVLTERRLDGGVWRISRPFASDFHQDHGNLSFNVIASCMHAGARVLTIRRILGTWSIKVLAKFTDHESMNYASDVRSSEDGFVIVSTSFYDRKLCVWVLKGVSESADSEITKLTT